MAKKAKSRKRGNGQGSVQRLPSGNWRWQITLGYKDDGSRETMGGTEATKGAAEIAKAKAIADHDRGMLVSNSPLVFQDYAHRWLDRQTALKPTSILAYRRELNYVMPIIGQMRIKDIRPHHIKTVLATLAEREMTGGRAKGQLMSARTLRHIRTRLRSVFQEALVDQIIHVNPCDAVKTQSSPQTESVGRVLDFPEMERLHEVGMAIYEAGLSRLFPAILTSASLGLRRSEVMGLRWQDIDFEQNILNIVQAVTTPSGRPHFGTPKTPNSRRKIPLTPTLRNLLKAHLQKQLVEKDTAGAAWIDSDAVFATELGAYTHPDNLGRTLRNLIDWSDPEKFTEHRWRGLPVRSRSKLEAIILAGQRLPDITPHDLRHTAATLMLRRRVPVEVVSKILGHSKVSVTLDIYRHVLESEKRIEMIDLFEEPLPERSVQVSLLN